MCGIYDYDNIIMFNHTIFSIVISFELFFLNLFVLLSFSLDLLLTFYVVGTGVSPNVNFDGDRGRINGANSLKNRCSSSLMQNR